MKYIIIILLIPALSFGQSKRSNLEQAGRSHIASDLLMVSAAGMLFASTRVPDGFDEQLIIVAGSAAFCSIVMHFHAWNMVIREGKKTSFIISPGKVGIAYRF